MDLSNVFELLQKFILRICFLGMFIQRKILFITFMSSYLWVAVTNLIVPSWQNIYKHCVNSSVYRLILTKVIVCEQTNFLGSAYRRCNTKYSLSKLIYALRFIIYYYTPWNKCNPFAAHLIFSSRHFLGADNFVVVFVILLLP